MRAKGARTGWIVIWDQWTLRTKRSGRGYPSISRGFPYPPPHIISLLLSGQPPLVSLKRALKKFFRVRKKGENASPGAMLDLREVRTLLGSGGAIGERLEAPR